MKTTFKNKWLAILLTAVMVLAAACSGEEGPMGPAGPKGDAGAQGVQGVQGIPGKDGNLFYSGTGAPAATLGKVGDMYLNKTNSTLYGPKTDAGWGTGVNLKGATGATGATGAAGSKILSGTGAPAATLGKVGDYYINKTNGDLYGPKTATSWGSALSLRGPQGIPGAAGSMFYSGSGAPLATLGKAGDMYLDKANSLLYGPKTATGWGAGLNIKGATGATGATGAPGTPGTPGSQILSGSGWPAETIGKKGDWYLDTNDASIYGPKQADTYWGNAAWTFLRGPQGSANVKHIDWRALPPAEKWSVDAGNASIYTNLSTIKGDFSISAATITAIAQGKYIVLGYIKDVRRSNFISLMPYRFNSWTFAQGPHEIRMGYRAYLEGNFDVELEVFPLGTQPVSPKTVDAQFRLIFVGVDGGILRSTASSHALKTELQKLSYEQVCERYGIEK